MAEHELFIPSAISQGCFYKNDEIIIPEANEFNYFIALLYLYRKKLIDDNSGIKIFIEQDTKELTSKKKPKQMLNPEFNNFTVQIEMIDFQELGVVNNNTYTLLKTYLEDKLNIHHIKIDILGTKKLVDKTRIKIVDNLTIDDDNILEITFTDEFVKMILHCEKYWMNVNLENIFDLTSHKAQKLYLLVKDYAGHQNGYIQVSKKQLEMIIGKIPQKATRDNLCKTITAKTDMEISIGDPSGYKLKKYKISFSENGNVKRRTKSKQKSKSKSKPKEIDENLFAEAKAKTEASIKRGNIVDDKEDFTWGIYHKLVKKQKHQPNQKELEEAKEKLNGIDIKGFQEVLKNEYGCFVGMKEYKLFDVFDTNKPPITNNALETVKVLSALE
ncbi:MAG: hypothetical protein COB17_00880 [Sulfurimonas sp.]|nr:MAG: hypothetical protein COB17_00880 [Sulfurimonas sp.]